MRPDSGLRTAAERLQMLDLALMMMAELVYWFNREQDIHPVLVSGISQFQFVHVHPFLDGNGRSLQRDLKAMVDMGLLVSDGSTNKLVYRMKETG